MKYALIVVLVSFCIMSGNPAWAESDKSTIPQVYDLVLKAHDVIASLGEEGLVAFNDPKGEFVYKDTYVLVLQCPEYVVAHPFAMDKLKGKDLSKIFPHQNTLCQAAENANGSWVEYQWPKPGETATSRKVGFVIPVEGTPYAVVAAIYNDDLTTEELNGTPKQ